MGFFEFVLHRVCWDSCMRISMYFIKFGKFLNISSNIFSASFSLSFPSETPIMYILVCLMVFHRSFRPCSFSSLVFFLSLRLGSYNCPIVTSDDSFFFLFMCAVECLLWILNFIYCTFEFHNFYFSLLNHFCLFVDNLYLDILYFFVHSRFKAL